MLAIICDDTRNVLDMQHISPKLETVVALKKRKG